MATPRTFLVPTARICVVGLDRQDGDSHINHEHLIAVVTAVDVSGL